MITIKCDDGESRRGESLERVIQEVPSEVMFTPSPKG